jgi:hypothetical protein
MRTVSIFRGYPAINTGKNHPDVVSAPSDEASGGICGGLAAIFRRILADRQSVSRWF